ncbi:MAG: hypothetical protein V1887_02075 [Candidatus Aenigmatarchaeota archaeon]
MERSRKVIFVSHLLLNQNAAAAGCERAPGAVKELLELLGESGIGIIQLPDPELECFGLDRKSKGKEALDTKAYRGTCKKHADDIVRQIESYMKSKYQIVGVLGVEFNPTWAVHQLANGTRNVPGKGVLIEELETAMHGKRYQIPIVGVNLNNIFSSAEKLQALLSCS